MAAFVALPARKCLGAARVRARQLVLLCSVRSVCRDTVRSQPFSLGARRVTNSNTASNIRHSHSIHTLVVCQLTP